MFFKAGYIESWGRGINKIMDACTDAGLPLPVIEEDQGGLGIIFLKDIYTADYLNTLDLNNRQVRAVLYIKEHGRITNKIYQALNNISKPAATLDLQSLVAKGFVIRAGTTGRGTHYILSRKG